MSNENDKNRLPDHYVSIVQQGRNGKEQITEVGALWEGKDGYMSGETIAGRILVQSRAKREELRAMRAEQAETGPLNGPEKSIDPGH